MLGTTAKTGFLTPRHLLVLGNRAAIDQALHRLVHQGVVRRVARGLYDIPIDHPTLGQLTPSADAVAKAVAESSGHQLQITPARAANLLGLSTQVPARLVYLTDGSSRQLKIGNQILQLKHASRRTMLGADVRLEWLIRLCGQLRTGVIQNERYGIFIRTLIHP